MLIMAGNKWFNMASEEPEQVNREIRIPLERGWKSTACPQFASPTVRENGFCIKQKFFPPPLIKKRAGEKSAFFVWLVF